MDTTSVLGFFADVGGGDGKSVGFCEKRSPSYSYQTTREEFKTTCEVVADMADLCPGTRECSALHLMRPKTVDLGQVQIVQVKTWEMILMTRRQQRRENMFLVLTFDFSPGRSGSFDLILVCERSACPCSCRKMLVMVGIMTSCAPLRPNSHGGLHANKERASDCGNDGTRQHRTPRGTSDPLEAQHDVWNDVEFVHLTCASVL